MTTRGLLACLALIVGFSISPTAMTTDGPAQVYGQHEDPAAAARALVELASQHLKEFTATKDFPLPELGHTRFYVITGGGVLTAEAVEADLGEGRSSLSPVFYAAHELIARMREIDEARDRER